MRIIRANAIRVGDVLDLDERDVRNENRAAVAMAYVRVSGLRGWAGASNDDQIVVYSAENLALPEFLDPDSSVILMTNRAA